MVYAEIVLVIVALERTTFAVEAPLGVLLLALLALVTTLAVLIVRMSFAAFSVFRLVVVSLAMSLGFVMLISPGGLGIRELILSTLLVPYLSVLLAMPSNASFTIDATALATIVSLLQRIISILAELSASLALFVVKVVRPSKTESMTEY